MKKRGNHLKSKRKSCKILYPNSIMTMDHRMGRVNNHISYQKLKELKWDKHILLMNNKKQEFMI